ncbi:hypothetical protein A8B82_07725 [Sulfitobacter sp. EhC04]|uniref:divergent polysaccharide deacetylase family protein n=1 Tax=Sulfitobacter sp. EhC04 TaxID=1849168 RepID=UPI0007F404DD|nr:divergent polysaccharide deacetylase family protein [Sulfitobacter sp. EhC04]OAN79272.1 hypothetical protein A8B82_07725 [Sulfitobacter sp. EhC04]
MARGFLKGAVLGGVVSVSVASIASVLLEPPMPPEVTDAAPGGTQAPAGPDGTATDTASLTDTAPASAPAAPQGVPPDPDTLATLDESATSPAAAPRTGSVEGLNAPEGGADSSGVAAEAESPVLPNPQALAPMAPQDPDTLSISTEPAQPPAPQAESGPFETTETAPSVPAAPEQPATPDVAEDVADTPDGVDSTADATPVVPETETPVQTTEAEPMPQAPEPETAEVTPQADPDTPPAVAEAVPEAETPPAAEAPEIPPVAETPETAESDAPATDSGTRPAIGTPAVTLTDRNSGVTVNRPGSATATEDSQQAQAEAPAEEGDITPESTVPPLEAYAQPYPPTDGKPLMGIVLIDDGSGLTSGAQGLAALRSFPYPLSFAVDASKPDAAERMALYREAGFEVVAMVGLPEGAQPSDAETTFNVVLPRLDQVVAVLEAPDGGFQASRDLSDQITAILADTGHGLITQDKGLNTMPKLARKEGVPADPIFRDFDSSGQSATVIRRFLDQAAFKAGQEGAVIMLGRLRPDTISALLLWGLQDRASSVALVPVSAVLTRE